MIMNNAIGGRHVIPPIVPCNESLRLFWKYGVDCPTVATASNRVMTYTPDYESYRIVSYRSIESILFSHYTLRSVVSRANIPLVVDSSPW